MPEEVLFESESAQDRAAIASYLRDVAAKLEAGEEVSLTAGDQSVTLSPPERPTFEVKAEREGPAGGQGELSIEFEIEWNEGESGGGSSGELSIE
ncbi:amphi-Trp domain-containing protein [Halobellus clavatus]|jgi:amphi-Trp domain-containing protein|uniref:Amphi-Trp domain-containing protein n=1 Tax=Halobellus clavatus TaxID=660517 RepID=A0A1H3E2N3_9EURY|nr:amphi-Trp domain-containing protein [Halobellus clavatus]SDX72982.1 amphi-Trp domain-containing protein [Halobellus clavatus]